MAFTHVELSKAGNNGVEAALELEVLRRHGAQGLSFDTILVSE